MELTGIQKFRAMNDRHTNLRDCEGMIIKPLAFHTHTYDDQDGKQHSVLVILNGIDRICVAAVLKTLSSAIVRKPSEAFLYNTVSFFFLEITESIS